MPNVSISRSPILRFETMSAIPPKSASFSIGFRAFAASCRNTRRAFPACYRLRDFCCAIRPFLHFPLVVHRVIRLFAYQFLGWNVRSIHNSPYIRRRLWKLCLCLWVYLLGNNTPFIVLVFSPRYRHDLCGSPAYWAYVTRTTPNSHSSDVFVSSIEPHPNLATMWM